MKYKVWDDCPMYPFNEGGRENHSLMLMGEFNTLELATQFIAEYTINVDEMFCPIIEVRP